MIAAYVSWRREARRYPRARLIQERKKSGRLKNSEYPEQTVNAKLNRTLKSMESQVVSEIPKLSS